MREMYLDISVRVKLNKTQLILYAPHQMVLFSYVSYLRECLLHPRLYKLEKPHYSQLSLLNTQLIND